MFNDDFFKVAAMLACGAGAYFVGKNSGVKVTTERYEMEKEIKMLNEKLEKMERQGLPPIPSSPSSCVNTD